MWYSYGTTNDSLCLTISPVIASIIAGTQSMPDYATQIFVESVEDGIKILHSQSKLFDLSKTYLDGNNFYLTENSRKSAQ